MGTCILYKFNQEQSYNVNIGITQTNNINCNSENKKQNTKVIEILNDKAFQKSL